MLNRSFMQVLAFFTGLLFVVSFDLTAGTIKGSVKARGLRIPENVVVYVSKAPETQLNAKATQFSIDQKNLTFLPHVTVIPVGATVLFPNNDEVDHNVFSLSRTKSFNFGNYGPGETKSIVFDKPGVIRLRCDMHAEMEGYVLVMKTIYFGITDKKGNFTIQDKRYLNKYGLKDIKELPAGKYTIRTWHEKLKSSKRTVIVPEKGEVTLNLKLKRGTPGKLYKR